MAREYERVEVESREQWRAWLEDHHEYSPGAWLLTFKKQAAPDRHLPYDDVVEEALCFGWVDSLGRKLDERPSQLLMTPRKPMSNWSRRNKERIERMVAVRLMAPAGLAAVQAAKANGAWTALDAVENLTEPDDLRAALDADPDARREWDGFPRSVNRGLLEWILNAKRPETRAKRVTETAESAAKGIRANQWRQPKRG